MNGTYDLVWESSAVDDGCQSGSHDDFETHDDWLIRIIFGM